MRTAEHLQEEISTQWTLQRRRFTNTNQVAERSAQKVEVGQLVLANNFLRQNLCDPMEKGSLLEPQHIKLCSRNTEITELKRLPARFADKKVELYFKRDDLN